MTSGLATLGERWMGGWVDGWMGRWVNGWMGGWVDRWMGKEKIYRTVSIAHAPILKSSHSPIQVRKSL